MNLKDYINSRMFSDATGIDEAISSRRNTISYDDLTYDDMTRLLDGLGFKNVGTSFSLPDVSNVRQYGVDGPGSEIISAQFKSGSKYYMLQVHYEYGANRIPTSILLIQQTKANDRLINAAYDRKTMDEVMEIFLDLLK